VTFLNFVTNAPSGSERSVGRPASGGRPTIATLTREPIREPISGWQRERYPAPDYSMSGLDLAHSREVRKRRASLSAFGRMPSRSAAPTNNALSRPL
jgi:hypothetical protein